MILWPIDQVHKAICVHSYGRQAPCLCVGVHTLQHQHVVAIARTLPRLVGGAVLAGRASVDTYITYEGMTMGLRQQ